jgi:hypothetical protein
LAVVLVARICTISIVLISLLDFSDGIKRPWMTNRQYIHRKTSSELVCLIYYLYAWYILSSSLYQFELGHLVAREAFRSGAKTKDELGHLVAREAFHWLVANVKLSLSNDSSLTTIFCMWSRDAKWVFWNWIWGSTTCPNQGMY